MSTAAATGAMTKLLIRSCNKRRTVGSVNSGIHGRCIVLLPWQIQRFQWSLPTATTTEQPRVFQWPQQPWRGYQKCYVSTQAPRKNDSQSSGLKDRDTGKKADHDIISRSREGQQQDQPQADVDAQHSDPPILSWVDQYLPEAAKPYARLARIDKPIGTWLLLWPCFWSTALAAETGGLPNVGLLALFATGAVTMRGAGCTVNDLWDRDIDRQVTRTSTRPLASGALTERQAVSFLALQLATGLAVLWSLPHTVYCFWWGAASLPLVFVYPTTKRWFPYPQLFLGLAINWGAWMGWAAVHGTMDWWTVAPLYGSGVTWTVLYDTIYAHQDKEEDSTLGLQSTALTFGDNEAAQRAVLHALAVATAAQWLAAGHQADLNMHCYGTGIAAAYGHLVWQIQTADFDLPHNLAERFRSNRTVGALVFASLVAGNYFG